jgi:hypothetical protein
MVVARVASTTLSIWALIRLFLGLSFRINTMPLSGLAGRIVKLESNPVCSPTPEQLTAFEIVV